MMFQGAAIIIPTFEGGAEEDSMEWKGFNGNMPIKYLISAPTMRVPHIIKDTVNPYLAFRAIILAGTWSGLHNFHPQ